MIKQGLHFVPLVNFKRDRQVDVGEGVDSFALVADRDNQLVARDEDFLGAAFHALPVDDLVGGDIHAGDSVVISCDKSRAEVRGALDMSYLVQPCDALNLRKLHERRCAAKPSAEQGVNGRRQLGACFFSVAVEDELQEAARLGHQDEFLGGLPREGGCPCCGDCSVFS